MQREYIENLKSGKVMIKGWVHEIRGLAKLKFLLIRDMTGMVQCVVKEDGLMKVVDDLSLEFISKIKNIIYISCNPESLLRDCKKLQNTHKITKFALFDQFPYTSHIESGVILKQN